MNYDSVPLRDFKELNDWETVMFVYQSALKQINTKIEPIFVAERCKAE